MNTKELAYAVEFSMCNSATEAAEHLGISRFSVIRNIKSLEDELGTQLFIRTADGIIPTASGEIFIQYAKSILRMNEDLRFELGENQEFLGRIDIGIGSNRAQYILPRVLSGFNKTYPNVTVRVHEKLTRELVPWLTEQRLDFAIAGESAVKDGIIFEPFIRDKLVLVAPDNDTFAAEHARREGGKQYISLAPFADKPLIVGYRNQESRRAVEKNFARMDTTPHVVFESGNSYTVALMAASGLGYGLCTEAALHVRGSEPIQYYYLEPEWLSEWSIGIATLENNRLSRLAEQLKKLILTTEYGAGI